MGKTGKRNGCIKKFRFYPWINHGYIYPCFTQNGFYGVVLYIVINNYLSIMLLRTYQIIVTIYIYLYLYLYTFNFSCVNCYENKIRWSLLLDL